MKFILGKLGLDAHDNGLRIITKWLRDAGHEVVYLGLYNNPKGMVRAALEEHAQVIGLSFLGGGHIAYVQQLIDHMHQEKMEDLKVIVGGVIPADEVEKLKDMGVAAVFTPGTAKEDILTTINSLAEGH
jgi:methylmalonyl-CoA mutase C-terminal domain/subunit